MPLQKTTKHQGKNITKKDIALLLKIISNKKKFNLFPLSENGKLIFEMAWGEQKNFDEIAEKLSLSRERVWQIYSIELRRFTYFIDVAFKEYQNLFNLKLENDRLKNQINKLEKGEHHIIKKIV